MTCDLPILLGTVPMKKRVVLASVETLRENKRAGNGDQLLLSTKAVGRFTYAEGLIIVETETEPSQTIETSIGYDYDGSCTIDTFDISAPLIIVVQEPDSDRKVFMTLDVKKLPNSEHPNARTLFNRTFDTICDELTEQGFIKKSLTVSAKSPYREGPSHLNVYPAISIDRAISIEIDPKSELGLELADHRDEMLSPVNVDGQRFVAVNLDKFENLPFTMALRHITREEGGK